MNCRLENCPDPVTWHPVLVFKHEKNGQTTTIKFTDVGACEEHHKTLGLSDFLSPEGFDRIIRILRETGKPIPVRKYSSLRWEPRCSQR